MNELIELVAQKSGISEEQARKAVDTVLGYLKQRLPAPIASQIDGILGGGATDSKESVADMGKGLGNLLNRK